MNSEAMSVATHKAMDSTAPHAAGDLNIRASTVSVVMPCTRSSISVGKIGRTVPLD